jgi:hypothetical protein
MPRTYARLGVIAPSIRIAALAVFARRRDRIALVRLRIFATRQATLA